METSAVDSDSDILAGPDEESSAAAVDVDVAGVPCTCRISPCTLQQSQPLLWPSSESP